MKDFALGLLLAYSLCLSGLLYYIVYSAIPIKPISIEVYQMMVNPQVTNNENNFRA